MGSSLTTEHTHQPAWASLAITATAVVIAAHGLVHVMGVALLWRLAEFRNLHYSDAVPGAGTIPGYLVGCLWLLATIMFVTAAILLALGKRAWRTAALAAVVISVPVVSLSYGQAWMGLVVDAIVLTLVLATWLTGRSGTGDSFGCRFP